jgi:hypothetical protein
MDYRKYEERSYAFWRIFSPFEKNETEHLPGYTVCCMFVSALSPWSSNSKCLSLVPVAHTCNPSYLGVY